MSVTENDVSLYGFATEEQQACFEMLTAVSGGGPKVGLAILSVMEPDRVALAISAGDHTAFTAASGVGPKLAQRIVLELKDKVAKGFVEGINLEDVAGASADTPAAQGAGQAIAALVSLGLAVINGEYIETIGIILAIILATTVGFVFEMDAARKFQSLTALGEEQPVKVIREGQTLEVARREVVVGDLIIVETGDEIPADARLIESTALQIDESSLTGEPMANKHVVDDSHPTDAEASYPSDLILRSSMVMGVRATARVEAVGDATEIGKVARKATELTAVKTPLNLQLTRLAKLISVVGTSISIAAFVIFLTHDILVNPLWHTANYVGMATVVLKYFMMAVTLIVMAVPEGLPMAVTLALALNMRRMLKSNNLVRKLHTCETMGAVTEICTDKTDTQPQNRRQVADL